MVRYAYWIQGTLGLANLKTGIAVRPEDDTLEQVAVFARQQCYIGSVPGMPAFVRLWHAPDSNAFNYEDLGDPIFAEWVNENGICDPPTE